MTMNTLQSNRLREFLHPAIDEMIDLAAEGDTRSIGFLESVMSIAVRSSHIHTSCMRQMRHSSNTAREFVTQIPKIVGWSTSIWKNNSILHKYLIALQRRCR
jgi:hypothetical protein